MKTKSYEEAYSEQMHIWKAYVNAMKYYDAAYDVGERVIKAAEAWKAVSASDVWKSFMAAVDAVIASADEATKLGKD